MLMTTTAHHPGPELGRHGQIPERPIAYVASRYPAISHTFIMREILGLRSLGMRVDTFTVRRVPDEDLLTATDRAESAATFSVLPAPPARLAGAIVRAVLTRPRRFARAIVRAIRAGRMVPRDILWQLFYVVEGTMLWDECRRRGIRHLHAHFANVGSDLCMVAADLGGSGWRWSFTMHGATEFYDLPGHRLAEKSRAAERVVCISDYCRSQILRLIPADTWDKVHVAHCGVDPEVFDMPQRTGRGDDRLSILCVGRLVADKGQDMLIDAVEDLERRGIHAEVTLVGDGPDRGRLEDRARRAGVLDRIHFAGSVGQDRIVERYHAADVFCLPSFAEGVPVVLMEAMATGLPVVTTLITGVPELVDDGVAGFLVRPGRSDLLADALERVARLDPAERDRMGREGRRRVTEEFSTERLAPVVARALGYDGLTAGGRP